MLLNKLRRPIKIRFYTTNNNTTNNKELTDMNIKLMNQNTKLFKELEAIKHPTLEPVKNECLSDKIESILCTSISLAFYSILLVLLFMTVCNCVDTDILAFLWLYFIVFFLFLLL